jgi:hypothetical protein
MLLVAFYVNPYPGRVAVRQFGATTEDIESAVAVLDVRVAEPHVLVGFTVAQRHGNCHSKYQQRWIQMRRERRAAVV